MTDSANIRLFMIGAYMRNIGWSRIFAKIKPCISGQIWVWGSLAKMLSAKHPCTHVGLCLFIYLHVKCVLNKNRARVLWPIIVINGCCGNG